MRKVLFSFLLILACASFSQAQNTTVSGTITDQAGQIFAGGSYKIEFNANGKNPPFQWNGGVLTPSTYSGTLNSSGAFSGVAVPSSSSISPAGTNWRFTVCPASTSPCFATTVFLTGTTMDVSGFIMPPAITVPANAYNQPTAYTDAEIIGPTVGFSYFNLTSQVTRTCTVAVPCTWVNNGGGSGIVNPGAQYQIPLYPNTGTISVLGPSNITTDATNNNLNVPGVLSSASAAISGNESVGSNLSVHGPRPFIDVTAYGAVVSAQTTTGAVNGTTAVTLASAIDFQNGQGIALYDAGPTSSLSAPTISSVAAYNQLPNIGLIGQPGLSCASTTATAVTRGWNGLTTGESVTIANAKDNSGSLVAVYNITATVTVVNQYTFTYTIASCPGNAGSYSPLDPATITLNDGSTTVSYKVAAIDPLSGGSAASATGNITTANPFVTLQPQVGLKVTWNYVSGATEYAVYRSIDSGSYSCIGTGIQPGFSSISPFFIDYGQASSCPTNLPSTPSGSATNQILITSIVSGGGTTSLVVANAATNTASGIAVQHDSTAAVTGAYAAACTAISNGGATVIFPSGVYYFQNPTLCSNSSVSIRTEIDGSIGNRQPFPIVDVSGYSIIGKSGAPNGPAHPTFASAQFLDFGQSPVILIRSANGTEIDNISITQASGDGILFDTDSFLGIGGPAGLKLVNVNITQNAGAGGYPLDCRNWKPDVNPVYDILISDSLFQVNNGLGSPSIYSQDCGQFSVSKTGLTGGGVFFDFLNTIGNIGFPGTWDFSGVFPEGLASALFQFRSSTSTQIANLIVSGAVPSDIQTGSDQTLISNLNGISQYGMQLKGNYIAPLVYGGDQSGSDINCAEVTSSCTGNPAELLNLPAGGFQGRYTDNLGSQWLFGNINEPTLRLVGLADNCQNQLQVEQPLGTIVSSFDCNGGLTITANSSQSTNILTLNGPSGATTTISKFLGMIYRSDICPASPPGFIVTICGTSTFGPLVLASASGFTGDYIDAYTPNSNSTKVASLDYLGNITATALMLSGNVTLTGLLSSGTLTDSLCQDSSGHVISISAANCFAASSTSWSSLTNGSGNLSIAPGGTTSLNTTTGLANMFGLFNTTAAIVSASQTSPSMGIFGTEWHGGASVTGGVNWQFTPGTGTDAASTFAFSHFGSATGTVTTTFPGPLQAGSSGSNAGAIVLPQGAAVGHGTANTTTIESAASVTSYEIVLPGTSATGVVERTNSSNVSTESIVATTGTGNVVQATSPTLVTPVLGAATATSLLSSGIVDGTAPITITTGTTANLGATYKSGYTFNQEATAGTGVTYTLPATAVGLQYCVQNSGTTSVVNTGVLTVYPASSSFVILNGVVNTVGGGGTHGVASGGAAGDGACFVAIDATHWEIFPLKGTWTLN